MSTDRLVIARAEEALAERLIQSEGGTAHASNHLLNATALYASDALETGDPESWDGGERCARRAAALLEKVADFCAENREALMTNFRRKN